MLPRGFFLALGLIDLAALALDRLAERLRIRSRVGAGLRLATVGVLVTLVCMGLLLMAVATPLADGLRFGAAAGLPLAAAWLTASCLTATDSGALEDLLRGLGHSVSGHLSRLLEFEAALSTVAALLCFGFLAGALQLHAHPEHLALHVEVARSMPTQMWLVLRHLLAGVIAGLLVGAIAPPLIDRLVRSEAQLLLLAISLAFVATTGWVRRSEAAACWPCSAPG